MVAVCVEVGAEDVAVVVGGDAAVAAGDDVAVGVDDVVAARVSVSLSVYSIAAR